MVGPVRSVAVVFCLAALFPAPPLAAQSPVNSAEPAAGDLEFDLSTPRRAVRSFIDSARAGDFKSAGKLINARAAGRLKQSREELARKLKFVLDREMWIDYDLLSDEPAGNPGDGARVEELGKLALGRDGVRVHLARYGGEWKFTRGTVAAIPALYREHGPPPILESRLPRSFFENRLWELDAWQWLGLPIALLVAIALALAFNFMGHRLWRTITKRTKVTWDDHLLEISRWPAAAFLALLFAWLFFGWLRLSVPAREFFGGILQSLLIVSVAWFLRRFIFFLAATLQEHLSAGAEDEFHARGVHTQVVVLRRVAVIILYTVSISLILLQFEIVRKVGMSLLASAGIAGIVIGLAAQKSIASILQGVQVALTQPVRIGDTVIVEGEWGSIEEINLTYVVVKIWDLRRLVVPISNFLDKPFQNWTKVSPDILGTIFVYADYTVPVERVRKAAVNFIQAHERWDGVAAGLLVTNATDRVVELRALISAANASHQWELRCATREFLIDYLQKLDGGRYLPRDRWQQPELDGPGPGRVAKKKTGR